MTSQELCYNSAPNTTYKEKSNTLEPLKEESKTSDFDKKYKKQDEEDYKFRKLILNNFYEGRSPLPVGAYRRGYTNARRQRLVAIQCILRYHAIFKDLEESLRMKLVMGIEKGCHDYACDYAKINSIPSNWISTKFVTMYNITCNKTQNNLKYTDDKSFLLIKDLVSGKIKPDTIAYKKSYELHPHKSQKERDEIRKRKQQKAKRRFCSQYTCFTCGQNKTIDDEKYTRGSDEPPTITITCYSDQCAGSTSWRL